MIVTKAANLNKFLYLGCISRLWENSSEKVLEKNKMWDVAKLIMPAIRRRSEGTSNRRAAIRFQNINTAEIEGDYAGRHNYMKQLLEKTNLSEKVGLSAPNRVQAGTYARNGKIEIEVMGHHDAETGTFSPTDNNKPYDQQPKTNSVATFSIAPDFSVTESFKPHDPEASSLS